ncbi:hypothetical protein [Nonomuraea dietziae]|uniref:hypothetical protein n=1 Tax=Nonomuraea dietziae TaxID=65515 RepID=UPI00343CF405
MHDTEALRLILALALIAAVPIGGFAGWILVSWWCRRRPWEDRLNTHVWIPYGGDYPDHWSPHLNQLDMELYVLERATWPNSEWQRVAKCEHPRLDVYATREAAELATNRAKPSRLIHCPCGGFHIRYGRTRTRARSSS